MLRSAQDTLVAVELEPAALEIAPIVVHAARGQTRLEEEPERVEVLAPEDVREKTLTRPGDLTTLLVEMGGIHVQSVSPGLGGAAVRVQGLPGRYTLLLTDGLPLSGAQAPALSLVQSPPLDLAQVEVIKGAATALYGPQALGGVVDLISKPPDGGRRALLSQTAQGETDGVAWWSGRLSERWGYTALAGAHRQSVDDVDGDGWSDLPGFRRVEARPRAFWTGAGGGTLLLTAGGAWEERTGGTLPGATLPNGAPFPESLDTRHVDVGAVGRFVLRPSAVVGVRASGAGTWRDRRFGARTEQDRRGTGLVEGTLGVTRSRHSAVLGGSAQRDGLRTEPPLLIKYGFTTLSAFASDTYTSFESLAVTASVRVDRHSPYGTFVSPRASLLWRPTSRLTVRASAGRGFNAPTPASEVTDELGFGLLIPNRDLGAVRGESASLDAGATLGPVQLSGTLFGVCLTDPVFPVTLPPPAFPRFTFRNASGPLRSVGTELFAVYAQEPLLITGTFSHVHATVLPIGRPERVELALTPRRAGGVDIAWEEDEPGESGMRAALEVFYVGRQRVDDDPYRTFTPSYATVELLLSKRFGPATVFLNGENLTDVRQSDWDPLLLRTPGRGGRWTTDQWAPLEGRVLRLGVLASL